METKIKGIDVSKWQGAINWTKVAGDGVKFAMIRLGYGSKKGTACKLDGNWANNVEGALANGISVGCYFYSYALTVEAVKKEAAFVIQQLAKYKGRILYPVAYDLEDKSQEGLGKETLTGMVKAFCSALEAAGYYSIFYSNPNWLKYKLDTPKLSKYDLWLAQWASAPSYKDRAFNMWQSSDKGTVAGISGNVDMNTSFVDFEALIKKNKLNGYTGSTTTSDVKTETTTSKLAFKVGDTVQFIGSKHYVNANATTGPKCKPGKAKVVATYKSGKHPYSLKYISGGGSTVYGWVDAKDVKECVEKETVSTKAEAAQHRDDSLRGTYKTTANLNMRAGAGTNKKVLTVIPKGKAVKCYGYYSTKNGAKWLYVVYNGVSGYCMKTYLTK